MRTHLLLRLLTLFLLPLFHTQASWSEEVVDLVHSASRSKGLAAAIKLLTSLQYTEPDVHVFSAAQVAAVEELIGFLEVEARSVIWSHEKRRAKWFQRRTAAAAAPHATGGEDVLPATPDSLPPPADEVEGANRLLKAAGEMRASLAANHAGRQCGNSSASSSSLDSSSPEAVAFQKVVGVALRMLTLSSSAAQPSGKEAQRVLVFFMTSLANKQLEKPPCVADMLSWSVLTPVYEEDVLYPLDAKQAAMDLGVPTHGHKGVQDLLTESEDCVSLMGYLR
jgi:hypothetical protein